MSSGIFRHGRRAWTRRRASDDGRLRAAPRELGGARACARGGRVLVGKDTRLSGYMFEAALEAGFVAAGVDVMLIGPLPTPGIAYLTQALRVRLRRRHQRLAQPLRRQRHQVLRPRRRKLADELEARIEPHLDEPALTRVPASSAARRASTSRACATRHSARRTVPGLDLTG